MLSLVVVVGNLFELYNLEIDAVVWHDILQFYFRDGRPPSNDIKEQCLSNINDIFNKQMDGLQMHGEMCTLLIPSSSCEYHSQKWNTKDEKSPYKGIYVCSLFMQNLSWLQRKYAGYLLFFPLCFSGK